MKHHICYTWLLFLLAVIGAGPAYGLNKLFVFDKYTVYAVGDDSAFYKTTDGGQTWTQVKHNLSDSLKISLTSLYFTTPQNGWAVGHISGFITKGYIWRTTDGGNTWKVQFGPENNYPFYDCYFFNDQNGLAVGQGYYRTSNGGAEWNLSGTHFSYGSGYDMIIQDIQFLTADFGWLATPGYIFRTLNGGSGWAMLKLPSYPFNIRFSALSFVNSETGWVAGSFSAGAGGMIVRIANGGADITYTPVSDTLNAICFLNSLTGVAVGTNIYRTTNGGETWTKITNGQFGELKDVKFADSNFGFAVGTNNKLVKTTDAGVTWTDRISFVPPSQDVYTLLFPQYLDGLIGTVSNRTRIVLKNNSTQPEAGDLFFQDDRGNPTTVTIQGQTSSQHSYSLLPWGTLDVVTDGMGPLKVGSIRLVSQRGAASEIEGTLVFEHLGFHVSVDSSPARSTHQVFVSRRSGEETGIAVYNPNAEAVTLDLTLLDNQGSQRAGGQLTLQAFEHKSLYIYQIDVFSGYFSSLQNFYGTLNIAVRGDKKISALGLLIKSTGAMIAVSTSAKVYR